MQESEQQKEAAEDMLPGGLVGISAVTFQRKCKLTVPCFPAESQLWLSGALSPGG